MSNRDLLLSKQNNDLIVSRFDLGIVEGVASTEQRLKVRLQIFLREWFLDRTAGQPYYEEVFSKAPNISEIEARLKEAILTTERVLEILSFDIDFNNASRTLFVNFAVSTIDGDIVIDDGINLNV